MGNVGRHDESGRAGCREEAAEVEVDEVAQVRKKVAAAEVEVGDVEEVVRSLRESVKMRTRGRLVLV